MNADKIKVQKCGDDQACPAIQFTDPSQITSNQECKDVPDPTPSGDVAPGDFCDSKEDCFGDDDKKDCKEVCTTKVEEGDSCADSDGNQEHRYCPSTMYCGKGSNNEDFTCQKQKEKDEECTDEGWYVCKTGLACLPKEKDSDTYTCQELFQIEAGTEIKVDKLRQNQYLGADAVCKTFYQKTLDSDKKTYCLNAPTTEGVDGEDESKLKREDGDGADCKIKVYEDPENPDKGEDKTNQSKCGFNKDTAGWCDKQRGDPWFQKVLKGVQDKPVSSLQCNPASPLTTCKEFVDGLGEDSLKQMNKELLAANEDYGFHLVAENEDCVKSAITQAYWMTKGDFGLNFNLASVSTIMLSVFALFYLF